MGLETTKVKPITPKGHIEPYEIIGYGIFCVEGNKKFVYNTNNLIRENDKELEIKDYQIRDLESGNLVAIVKYKKQGEKIRDFFKATEIE